MNNQLKNTRILALDVMRGITIVGMIFFNTNSGHHYAPLHHAQWIGLNPADLAFPFFMFMMGITTYISLKKYNFEPTAKTFRKIITRALGIIFICIAFDWFHDILFYWDKAHTGIPFSTQILDSITQWDKLRLSGVLVRLGLCYGLCAMIAVTLKHKTIPYIIVGLMLIYFLILQFGNGFVQDETNIVGIVDRSTLGLEHMYNDHGIDPEGILSTIPALAHVLLGFWVGENLLSGKLFGNKGTDLEPKEKLNKQTMFLFIIGAMLLFSGYLLSYGCPISKKLWSPTFVLVTCGAGSSLLGLLIYLIDIKGHKERWTEFFKVFGANPLVLYLLSEALLWIFHFISFNVDGKKMDLWKVIYRKLLVPLFGEYGGDLAFAIFIVLCCWFVGYILHRKKIYIKL